MKGSHTKNHPHIHLDIAPKTNVQISMEDSHFKGKIPNDLFDEKNQILMNLENNFEQKPNTYCLKSKLHSISYPDPIRMG
jgi:hypothetical protein